MQFDVYARFTHYNLLNVVDFVLTFLDFSSMVYRWTISLGFDDVFFFGLSVFASKRIFAYIYMRIPSLFV